MNNERKTKIRAIALAAVLAALAAILQIFEFPLPFLIPAFVKFDFSDLPALIASFALGPFYGAGVCLVKNVIHLLTSSSAGIGELANFLIGVFFVVPAGMIYKHKKTKSSAVRGACIGIVAGAAMSFPVNLYITYPFYSKLMPIDTILEMYNNIFNISTQLWQALLIFNVPFTLLKFAADTLITVLIYKHISPLLHRFVGKE
ncbi:MAG TPA: ECF transporter S component [Bacillota bacterium]|nr:ECF transporter S component [Bacillota bacterium]